MKYLSILLISLFIATTASAGEYLGNLNNNKYDPNSISNPYGQYGSKYSSKSINNPYGQYGSKYSNKSATNPYASKPPVIYNNGQPVGKLTANPYQRQPKTINPDNTNLKVYGQ